MSGVAVAVVMVLIVLAGRVGWVAVVQQGHWRAAAAAQSQSRIVLSANRGNITDRNGVDLATDTGQSSVIVDPQLVDNADDYAKTLAPVLGIDEPTLKYKLRKQRIGKQWLQYRVIAQNVDKPTADLLDQMAFPGISVQHSPTRLYPAGSLAASVIGRTVPGTYGPVGASGLELQYNDLLHATPGTLVSDQADGTTIPGTSHYRAPHSGGDVVLGLDEGIQYQAEQTLLAQVAAQNARAGAAVVMDLQTGDILSMASVEGGAKPHVAKATDANLPLTYSYSPGSVMKIVAISKAFDSGCIQTTSHFTVPYSIMNGTFPLTDDENHVTESWTPWDILTQSSNVGSAEIAKSCFSPTSFDAALRSFGFGKTTGIGFNKQEATGRLLPPSLYGESGLMADAIGYSLLVTPMQILDAYATIARGGVPIQPRLVRSVIDADGVRHDTPVRTGKRIVSAQTALTMQQIFENVVRAGTGFCAAVPGYEVAGKTGTVKKLTGKDAGGHYQTFVGFAPATKPRLAAIVMVDDGAAGYGNTVAAPAWSQIMGTALLRTQTPAPAPMPNLAPQYAQAQTNHNVSACGIPSFQATMQRRAANAYAAAHPTTTTTSTTSTTSTTTAASKHAKGDTHHGATTTTPAPVTTTTTQKRTVPSATTTTVFKPD